MTRADLLKVAKPVLFNTEMVKAILEDRKKVTRRVIKPQLDKMCPTGRYAHDEYIYDVIAQKIYCARCGEPLRPQKKAPFHPADILYVRETWRVGAWDVINHTIAFDYRDGTCGKLIYMHDRELFDRLVNQSRDDARELGCVYNGADFVWEKGKSPCRWRPSIHMPKEASRIFLKVTDVRVERLQDMTVTDLQKEGILPEGYLSQFSVLTINCFEEFGKLWNSTIKKSDLALYGWDANPWVWVIEFERIESKGE